MKNQRIEVLMSGSVAEAIKHELKGIKLFNEAHGRKSFICSLEQFERIHREVTLIANPYAAMNWNEL